MPELPDMSLTINVLLYGTVDAGGNPSLKTEYVQGPSIPDSINVVAINGDIDLNNMAYDSSRYSTDTDITVNLSGLITDENGDSVNCSFPSSLEQAVTITREDGGRSDIHALAGGSPRQLIIDDNDKESAEYTYCLHVLLGNGAIVSLDPRIVNR